jgi:glycyl-tRNA synthetase beta chain
VDAVLAYDLDPLVETVAKIRALETFKEREEFESLLGTVKRVVKILKEPVDESVDPNTFVNQAETDLYRQLTACEQDLKEALAARDYNAALERLRQLKDPIDRFFEEVLVLDKNLSLRQNRLALLTRTAGLFQQVADFSRIVP